MLKQLAAKVSLKKFQKSKRGPKRPQPKRKYSGNGQHVATARLLARRNNGIHTFKGLGLTGYVFAGANLGQFTDFQDEFQIIGSDGIDPGATGMGLLLARRNLEHVDTAAAVGEQFRVTLQQLPFPDDNTLFEGDGFTPLPVDASSFNPLIGGGLITVTAAAVPEPSTWAILVLARAASACDTGVAANCPSRSTLRLLAFCRAILDSSRVV